MSSNVIQVLAALMIFVSAAFIIYGVQRTRARASTPEMEERLDRFGSLATAVPAEDAAGMRPGQAVTERIDRAVKGKSFGEKMATALARADLRMTIGEWVMIRAGSAVVGFLFGLFFGRTAAALALLFGIVFAVIGWMVPQLYLRFRARRRTRAFVNQLGDTIGLMANSLRAGYSLLQTLELISRESPPPMCDEFRRVVREVGLGMTPQQALNNMLRRIPSEDLDLLVSAINIQHEIGGNLGQILDIIGETIRERVRIQGEIGVLTAQVSLSGNIIAGMPVVLALVLYLLNPGYISTLFVWPWVCIPIGAGTLLVTGYFVMRKIAHIEV